MDILPSEGNYLLVVIPKMGPKVSTPTKAFARVAGFRTISKTIKKTMKVFLRIVHSKVLVKMSRVVVYTRHRVSWDEDSRVGCAGARGIILGRLGVRHTVPSWEGVQRVVFTVTCYS